MNQQFLVGQKLSVQFTVSEEMVRNFADLIGDHSSLHVDDVYARRSIFRSPIVHGMLPFAFLAALDGLRVEGLLCKLMSAKGRFVAPIFRGDDLELSAAVTEASDVHKTVVWKFRIERLQRHERITEGQFTVAYEAVPKPTGEVPKRQSASALLENEIEMRACELADLAAGQLESFKFSVSEPGIECLRSTLATGLRLKSQKSLGKSEFHYGNLLAILMFSTLVGMRIPGSTATFVEFSASVDRDVANDVSYELTGTVAHVSKAARVVKTDIQVRADSERSEALTGRTVTLVNSKPSPMPSLAELRTSAVDLGLRDSVALVTGASRGIGETIAKLLALFGAKVVINYFRGKDDAERIASEIVHDGGEAIALQADVRDFDEVSSMIDQAVRQFGGIDILVNNAVRDFRPVGFAELTWEDIEMDIDVTVKGALNCCRVVAPIMSDRGGGKIVAISSSAVDDPPPNQIKYVVSKSALDGLVRALAVEFAPRNIQVNTVVPHFVETDLTAHIQESFRDKIARESPMGRNATAIDVAHAVVFLASAFSSYTTGQRLLVTGGRPPYL